MPEPLTSKPKITNLDVIRGYVTRYFVRMVSGRKVIEVDKAQYENFKTNPFYQTVQVNWIINGNDEDITTSDGKVLRGVKHQNSVLIEYYNTDMPGIASILRDPLEYFSGKRINLSR